MCILHFHVLCIRVVVSGPLVLGMLPGIELFCPKTFIDSHVWEAGIVYHKAEPI